MSWTASAEAAGPHGASAGGCGRSSTTTPRCASTTRWSRAGRASPRSTCAAHVADEALRAALTPDYPFRCKRVLLGGDYYAALQRDNVTLVTDPIRDVTATAVCTAAGAVGVDVIVLATGFQTNHYLSGIDVVGVAGQSLHDRWGEEPSAYLGVAVSRVPEFLHVVRAQHQPGRQLDRLHPGGRCPPGGRRRGPDCAQGWIRWTCGPRPSGGSTTRSGPNWSRRSGPSAAATFGRRAAGSSPSGPTTNSTTPGARGDCG